MTIEEFLSTLLLAWGIKKGEHYLDKAWELLKGRIKKKKAGFV